jgi:TRAP-type uncharacterized transport system fused permease subunit
MLILCLSWMAVTLFASTDSLFQAANALYQDGSYEEALHTYNEIIQQGVESPDLYYNMGNAAFRSNNIGHAILYYEKALKLDPGHEDAKNNLEFVSSYRVDTFDEVPELFIRSWARSMVNALPEKTWSLLSISLFLLILISLLVYIFSHRLGIKKAGFFSAVIAVLFFALTFTAALSRHKHMVNPDTGVIVAPSVIVRSSPSETGTELFVLHEGTKVRVNEEVSGWRNIRVIDGREGWITSGDFESI